MNKKRIEVGDSVVFNFDNEAIGGVVDYAPCQAGDCWIIVDPFDVVHYMRNFNYITLDGKAGE